MENSIIRSLIWEGDAISESTPIVVKMDADLSVVVRKMFVTKRGVICIDFSGGKNGLWGLLLPVP